MTSSRIAVITGGASGMGLAVATALSQLSGWSINIIDLAPAGPAIAQSIGASFYECNVTHEAALGAIFKSIYTQHGQLDFVFANAGIAERANFYHDVDIEDNSQGPELPVKGMHDLVDINLKSVITTVYLGSHFMRRSPIGINKSIVLTASCGGIYPSFYSPIYTGTKHAVVGFMRSIAPWFYNQAGIRVNAICPGIVKTNLLSAREWTDFPEDYFTPVEKVVNVVLMLVDGKDDGSGHFSEEVGTDAGSRKLLYGRTVEISGQEHYYREALPFSDEAMEALMGSTNVEIHQDAHRV